MMDKLASAYEMDAEQFRIFARSIKENTMIPWDTLVILGMDAETVIGSYRYASSNLAREEIVNALIDYRDGGCISGYFIKPLEGQEDLEPWEWGPSSEDVDWTGFDEALEEIGNR